MGASQSKLPEPILQEKLAERLQALEVKDHQRDSEKDYVYVDEEQRYHRADIPQRSRSAPPNGGRRSSCRTPRYVRSVVEIKL